MELISPRDTPKTTSEVKPLGLAEASTEIKGEKRSVAEASAKIKEALSLSSGVPAKKAKVTMKRPAAATADESGSPADVHGHAKRSVSREGSRFQYRCRNADGTSFAIPWGDRKGEWTMTEDEAFEEASKWLDAEMST